MTDNPADDRALTRRYGRPGVPVTVHGVAYGSVGEFYRTMAEKYQVNTSTLSGAWRSVLDMSLAEIEDRAKALHAKRQTKRRQAAE